MSSFDSAAGLNVEVLDGLRTSFIADKSSKVLQNALAHSSIGNLTLNREVVQNTDASFSTKLDKWSVTNQKSSGRCWLFAYLNVWRVNAMSKMNLKEFEFSQNYLFFWDKLERVNQFCEAMIETADRDVDDRTIAYILDNPIIDGGQWNMAQNLLKKYGVCPKSAFPETESSSATMKMNAMLKTVLRKACCDLRCIMTEGGGVAAARVHKDAVVADAFKILCLNLGTPPKTFDWQYRDANEKFFSKGTMTPQQFAAEYIDKDALTYMCLVNDPRNEYLQTYSVDYLQNVRGGDNVIYLNVEVGMMKELTRKMIEDEGKPVWMGCDVGKCFDRKNGLWDVGIFEDDAFYGVNSAMTKAQRLVHHDTLMTHAMLFTGVDTETTTGAVRRWRVENSWGDTGGNKGFYTMNDNWFDQYMFEIAVPQAFLSEEIMAAFQKVPILLPAWDPMGSLASADSSA